MAIFSFPYVHPPDFIGVTNPRVLQTNAQGQMPVGETRASGSKLYRITRAGLPEPVVSRIQDHRQREYRTEHIWDTNPTIGGGIGIYCSNQTINKILKDPFMLIIL